MKKRHGLGRAIAPIERSAAEALSTRALLARLERLRWCEEGPATSDLTAEEIASAKSLILFKNDETWRVAYADIKDILAKREHVA